MTDKQRTRTVRDEPWATLVGLAVMALFFKAVSLYKSALGSD